MQHGLERSLCDLVFENTATSLVGFARIACKMNFLHMLQWEGIEITHGVIVLVCCGDMHVVHIKQQATAGARGDFERATNALKAAIFWNPKLVSAHVLLGRISVLKNDCPGAQVAVAKALQVDSNDPDAQALKRLIDEKCKPNSQ